MMRKLSIVIRLVAMLALLIGSLPMSAMASQGMADCNMACCTGKPLHQVADETCSEGCDEPIAQQQVSIDEMDGCDCTISDVPNNPSPVTMVAPMEGGVKHPVAALPIVFDQFVVTGFRATPFIFGSDSSPPSHDVEHTSLGRAPPVRFA